MDIPIELNGKTYTVTGGINTLRRIETALSTERNRVTYAQALAFGNSGSVTHLVVILWAMLRKHHAAMTQDEVGDLIDAAGLPALNAAFEAALVEMFPDPADLKQLGITPTNPRKAQTTRPKKGGTGARSNLRRAG